MDVKQAVTAARQHFSDVFEQEATLEEVWFDDHENVWCITFSLRRPDPGSWRDPIGATKLHYKTVRISDADGKPISIRNRDAAAA